MSQAGSALMGIGRSGGENRAVVAAQQAIESPLLEVSIDGARGILFNVIGGNDLAMHEINAAAEAITAAADPNANIIFGATINPDLEGEVIITVVATGFDASYFSTRDETPPKKGTITERSELDVSSPKSSKQEEKTLSEIDMNLEDESDAHADFTSDKPIPNIWAIHDDEDDDKKSDDDEDKDSSDKTDKDKSKDVDHEVVSSDLEDELEKPSFLRRLGRRKKHDEESDDEPKGE